MSLASSLPRAISARAARDLAERSVKLQKVSACSGNCRNGKSDGIESSAKHSSNLLA